MLTCWSCYRQPFLGNSFTTWNCNDGNNKALCTALAIKSDSSPKFTTLKMVICIETETSFTSVHIQMRSNFEDYDTDIEINYWYK